MRKARTFVIICIICNMVVTIHQSIVDISLDKGKLSNGSELIHTGAASLIDLLFLERSAMIA